MGVPNTKPLTAAQMAKNFEVVTAGATVKYDPDPTRYFVVLTAGSENNPSTDLHTMAHVTDNTYSQSAAVQIIRRMGCGSWQRHTKPRSVYLVKSYGWPWDALKYNWPWEAKFPLARSLTSDHILRANTKTVGTWMFGKSAFTKPLVFVVDNGQQTRSPEIENQLVAPDGDNDDKPPGSG